METKPKTIDAAPRALAAGTITDAQVMATFSRSSWLSYELLRGGPVAERDAYWRILDLMPQTPEPILTAAMETLDAEIWREEQAQRRNDDF